MSEVKEIRPLTGLRGLAAIYVVVFHYLPGIGFTSFPLTFLAHGYLAVDLFFVLSGFVMTLNYSELFRGESQWKSFRIFLSRRVARVYPLYVVATLCAAAMLSLGWLEGPHASVKAMLLPNLLMVQVWGFAHSLDSPGWSISAEWAAYIVFPLALWLGRNSTGKRARATLFCALIAVAILCWLPPNIVHRSHPLALLDISEPWGGWPVFRCLPEFFLGIYAARLFAEEKYQRLRNSGVAATTIAAVLLVLLAIRGSDFVFVALCPLLILCLTAKTGLAVRVTGSRVIHHLGVLSYSIYLVHALLEGVVALVHGYASRKGLQHGQTYGATVAILLVYPLSVAVYQFVERPGRQLARRLLERNRKTPSPMGPLGTGTTR